MIVSFMIQVGGGNSQTIHCVMNVEIQAVAENH